MPRGTRAAITDLALVWIAFVGAAVMSHGSALGFSFSTITAGAVFGAGAIAGLAWAGIYKTSTRYFGFGDLVPIFVVATLGSAATGLYVASFEVQVTSRLALLQSLIFGLLVLVSVAGARVFQHLRHNSASVSVSDNDLKRTLVVGAGDAGDLMVVEMRRSKTSKSLPVGFVDDNPAKRGLMIRGVPVLGTTADIPSLCQSERIDEIVLAVPSASGDQMRRLHEVCQSTGLSVRTVPSAAELQASFHHLPHRLREVDIEDLLRRETLRDEDMSAAEKYIKNARVLITGGGGSIGSELARQVAKLKPAELVLIGKGENSLFETQQDLLRREFEAQCVVADIRDRAALESVFERYRPTVVFHAAAHKHVPLMEHNAIEAVKNNVLGTKNVVELSARFGVKKFVQISTDKAVNPGNVMGATKRVAEMIVRDASQRSETEFAIVRFGNVLGSRGSLVPLLKRQIREGGPVTLTDARMTRFFMTIPEAVHLILQAGALGRGGDVFILDMGEPVRIQDLAEELIRLHGLTPHEDIKIEFMGARPGEKLHEELNYSSESLEQTQFAKVRRISAPSRIDESWLSEEVRTLLELCEARNQEQVRGRLMQLATEDSPSPLRFAVVEEEPARDLSKDL